MSSLWFRFWCLLNLDLKLSSLLSDGSIEIKPSQIQFSVNTFFNEVLLFCTGPFSLWGQGPLPICGLAGSRPMREGLMYVCTSSRGCREIWEALILRTSNMASALVRNQMSTCPKWIKLICAIIISLDPGQIEWNFRWTIFKQILLIDGWSIY